MLHVYLWMDRENKTKKEMRNFFIVWIGIAIILFIIGSTVGENKGTTDSFMYWPIIGWIAAGLLYLVYQLIIKKVLKVFSR